MSGRTRRTNRVRPNSNPTVSQSTPYRTRTRTRNPNNGPIHLINVRIRTLLFLGFGFLFLLYAIFLIYSFNNGSNEDSEDMKKLMRVVTPLNAPKMMDLAQFQGEHKESLYWGTYRPHVYLGIRARTPKSLIAGLMWLGIKNGQYFLRHVCQDSDDLKTYGWTDHNGRDYGNQTIVDQELHITTSFLKVRGHGSGFGGDWAVRISAQLEKVRFDDAKWSDVHLFFYIADEEGNTLSLGPRDYDSKEDHPLISGLREDVGGWELHLKSQDKMEVHHAGFKTPHMHNLTELVQGTLAVNARRTGQIQLPDASEESPNIAVFQITTKLPSTFDIAFVSGTNLKIPRLEERINNLTGNALTFQLKKKQEDFEEKYMHCFGTKDKADSESMVVGRAAIGNMLGGIGYFYGQSKISFPKGFKVKNGDQFLSYWPAALYTAVPSRSFFPRGFLWDEGFHQLIIWRWDIKISMDVIGHWLDLINMDGWIPREQILGPEALSKVPEEFVLQHPSNGNPPTLFLLLRDLISSSRTNRLLPEEKEEIKTFLNRAYNRLGTWFEWFNTTQRGKDVDSFYWHGRDSTTNKELNPKSLSSGLDDYPRASHPSNDERHLDLRCWMLLAANCMDSISQLIETNLGKVYHRMAEKLSKFEILNQMHLDDVSGSYFDFGNHTEKVRLKWHEVQGVDNKKRELLRETLEKPKLSLVPHFGYVSLFPFMMGIIPPDSWVLEKQLELISNRSTLWTDYGLRSLSKTSSIYMKRNTEHDPPYWRGPIWINMNYLILSALHHYSQADGPYREKSQTLYKELRSNLIRTIVQDYQKTGFLWEQYNQKNKGKGKGARPFTGWTSLIVLIMAEDYPSL